ncbi:MAG TPA: 2OG-Fe(II) oxygenase [Gammaproteobacteria bacterium]|nr:2OG-Fe(II) oxygenase [Gammaproteobacteria bacterium]
MQDQLVNLIVQRLTECKENLKNQFFSKHAIPVARHFILDNLLPLEIAEKIHAAFPKKNEMRLLKIGGELKLKYSHIKNTSDLLQDFHHAISHPTVISMMESITEIPDQMPDTSRIAGGASMMLKGGYINPHIDHSHDIDKKFYRVLNTLYYVTPGWALENGGNYELWDTAIENRMIIPSLFNRLLVMETNQTSWHAVNPVLCDGERRCIFNYYFSKQSPQTNDYFHDASFPLHNPLIRPRPEQKIRRVIHKIKGKLFGKPW